MVVDFCRYVRLRVNDQTIKEKHGGQKLGVGEFGGVRFTTHRYFSHYFFALTEKGPDLLRFTCPCILCYWCAN